MSISIGNGPLGLPLQQPAVVPPSAVALAVQPAEAVPPTAVKATARDDGANTAGKGNTGRNAGNDAARGRLVDVRA